MAIKKKKPNKHKSVDAESFVRIGQAIRDCIDSSRDKSALTSVNDLNKMLVELARVFENEAFLLRSMR